MMKYDPDKHHRRSIRLRGYDYSQAGAYFVTICTKDRELYFEDSAIETVAKNYWLAIPDHYPNVIVDEFVVMPNHVHGVLLISDVRVQNFEPQRNEFQRTLPKSLGSIVRTYKSAVTSWCKNNGHEEFAWQRNYYEHIIRNETDLNAIRQYIIDNPIKWEGDEDNPQIFDRGRPVCLP